LSKRALKEYLQSLEKHQLEEQILDLYHRFKEVKTFYNFVFNPKEEKLVEECKLKISKEYFPTNGRKPKMRRSTAQKAIRHFIQLGMENGLIADVMIYNLEIAQTFSAQKELKQQAFYTSLSNSFQQALDFVLKSGLWSDFDKRLQKVVEEAQQQNWFNAEAFETNYAQSKQLFQS
jgi:hypothetical protein